MLDFYEFVNERHAIYLRKLWLAQPKGVRPGRSIQLALDCGPPPGLTLTKTNLTSDEVLQIFRFGNVFREMDPTTLWMHSNVRLPFGGIDPDSKKLLYENLWFMVALARTAGPRALEKKFFTEDRLWPVHEESFSLRGLPLPNLQRVVIGGLWRNRAAIEPGLRVSAQTAHEVLSPYCGEVLAYQIVADLQNTPYLRSHELNNSWTFISPYVWKGIETMVNSRLSHDEALEAVSRLWDRLKGYRAATLPTHDSLLTWPLARWVPPFQHMTDINKALYEYGRYVLIMGGGEGDLYKPGRRG